MPARNRLPQWMAFFLLSILRITTAGAAEPQEPWRPAYLPVWIDANRSSEAGADDLIAAHYGMARLENRVLPPRLWEENGFLARAGGIGYRALRLGLIDFPLAVASTTFQHEYSGHGFRGREEDFQRITYTIDLPPPYGDGAGATHLRGSRAHPESWDMAVLMAMGGVEAEGVAADRMRLMWMQTGSMDPAGALLYSQLRNALPSYLGATDEETLDEPDPDLGNDMLAYVSFLNQKERGQGPRADWKLHLRRIEDQAQWTWADPFQYYALGAILVSGLWYGRASESVWSVPLGPVGWLPAVGYGLGPWGPEYRIENLFVYEGRALQIGYRFGDDTFRRSWGWDAVSLGLLRAADWIVDFDAHYWAQPRLATGLPRELGDPTEYPRERGIAAGLQAASPAWIERLPVRAWAGAGWKSAGWIRGRDWEEGPYWRLGLAWTPARPEAP